MAIKIFMLFLIIILGIYIIINSAPKKKETNLDSKIKTRDYVLSLAYKRISKKGKEKVIYLNVSAYNMRSLKYKVESFIKDNIKFIVKTGSLIPEKLYVYSSKINKSDSESENRDIEKIEAEVIKFIKDNSKLNKIYNEIEAIRS